MEQKLDLRIQKTYLALSGALLEAMGEKPFEDIRVNELCDRAMVRKSTFYKHFGDKYELLAFVVRQGLRRFDAQIGEGSTADMDPVDSYGRIIDCLFDYLRGNEHLIRSVSGSGCFPLVLISCRSRSSGTSRTSCGRTAGRATKCLPRPR